MDFPFGRANQVSGRVLGAQGKRPFPDLIKREITFGIRIGHGFKGKGAAALYLHLRKGNGVNPGTVEKGTGNPAPAFKTNMDLNLFTAGLQGTITLAFSSAARVEYFDPKGAHGHIFETKTTLAVAGKISQGLARGIGIENHTGVGYDRIVVRCQYFPVNGSPGIQHHIDVHLFIVRTDLSIGPSSHVGGVIISRNREFTLINVGEHKTSIRAFGSRIALKRITHIF